MKNLKLSHRCCLLKLLSFWVVKIPVKIPKRYLFLFVFLIVPCVDLPPSMSITTKYLLKQLYRAKTILIFHNFMTLRQQGFTFSFFPIHVHCEKERLAKASKFSFIVPSLGFALALGFPSLLLTGAGWVSSLVWLPFLWCLFLCLRSADFLFSPFLSWGGGELGVEGELYSCQDFILF